QEVIARQLTYDKVTRHLVGLRSAEEMAAGSEVRVGKQTIGMVTSAAFSPRLGHLALAYLKRPYHEPGTAVRVGQEEASVTATVSSLPFSSSSH
ncbi:MAG: glycine cleavage system protein T, partial [Caldilineae bacterium]